MHRGRYSWRHHTSLATQSQWATCCRVPVAQTLSAGVGLRRSAGISAHAFLLLENTQWELLLVSANCTNCVRGNIPDRYNKLVPVGREYGEREPEWPAVLIKACSEDLDYRHPAVVWQFEEGGLVLIWRAHRDPVPVTGLPDPERVRQISDYAPVDVGGLNEPYGTCIHEAHRVESRL